MVFERFRTGLVFVLQLNTIFGFKYQATTQPRLLAFKFRLENESRVGTPLRRNLEKDDISFLHHQGLNPGRLKIIVLTIELRSVIIYLWSNCWMKYSWLIHLWWNINQCVKYCRACKIKKILA